MQLNAFDASTYAMVPVGGLVDLTSVIPLPEGFPENWDSMNPFEQAAHVSADAGCTLAPVLEEPGVAFAFNGKGVANATCSAPAGYTIHATLVDGDKTVFYRGHGENAEYTSNTVRVEALIPGGGGLCQNWHDVLVYEASNTNVVHGLGEVAQCPPLPAHRYDEINPALGERVEEISELAGADVISIGTVEKGLGAWWVYSNGLGTQDVTCPAGSYTCVFTLDGTSWNWAEAGQLIEGAQGVIIMDTSVVSDPASLVSDLTE
ncbi:hypothetical protein ACFL0C_00165 [Patescibacteria group bacterium]